MKNNELTLVKRVCKRCGNEVIKSELLEEYSYQCMECDEDFYSFETELIKIDK